MTLWQTVKTWQADQIVPTETLRYIGALRTYAARMNFYLAVPNTLMIGVLFYNDSAVLQSVFPTMWHWVGFILFVVVPLGVATDRLLLHPAQIIYNMGQNDHEERSPNHRETVANQRRLDDLHERLDKMGAPEAERRDA